MSIVPIALISTAMPSIIRKIKTTESKNRSLEISIFKILFIFSFLIFALIAFKASEFVSIIFGSEYLEASLPTIILFGSNIFLFCNYFSLDLLTVHHKQKISFYYSLLIVVIDIFIIILLLSDYSYVGAAVAKLVAILSGFITLEFIFYYRKFEFSLVNFKSLIFIICSLLVFYLLSFLNIILYSLISLIISVLLVFLLKFFENDELRLLLKVINKEKWIEKFSRI
jgi:O-antigen/teichoic acid export membrane protein